jgi:hypothetical protein
VGEQFGFGLADVLFRGKADCSAPALDAEHGTVTGERLAWLA